MNNTALSLPSHSKLPARFANMLSTPSDSKVEQLWWQFRGQEESLNKTHEMINSPSTKQSISLLLRSSLKDLNEPINCSLFGSSLENAKKILQQQYWEEAIDLTDVKFHMPNNRRIEWRENVKAFNFPDFTLENLFSTLSTLLLERDKFIAERVEGVFNALSKSHVTNTPEGFYKRMIISDIHRDGFPCSTRCGYINDLRIVVGRFLGRENDNVVSSYDLVKRLMLHTGQWVEIDGGTLRIRVYKKGTAHIEIHPDLAWQLNEILAMLYPRAIPSQFRTKQKKKIKHVNLSNTLLNHDVINELGQIQPVYEMKGKPGFNLSRGNKIENRVTPRYPFSMDKHLLAKVSDVLIAIGGIALEKHEFQFDYDPMPIIEQVYFEGRIPDKYSHQFYPTPAPLAKRMADLLGNVQGLLLEPEAGQGALAEYLGKDATLVEVSSLHCEILKQKGFKNVICDDFIKWAHKTVKTNTRFAGILMNPPFSEGRAVHHLDAAISLLADKGKIVGLVTLPVANNYYAEGMSKQITPVAQKEFKGVSVDLAIIELSKL
ncbi:hypothetical protein BM526_19125 (plasmid) [Alteromonas mediterranea]|uniref:DUF4942 domain-containing protein n=1 Tax=Alteromonas mediterranea TaxID=314275 RepID=UPI000904492B|nr:DUF4942 domain-containing protein [Alteromonas mediterranea]APE04082.1 hypothetical protein BM526_19125 [Alteromonas mediterranea]